MSTLMMKSIMEQPTVIQRLLDQGLRAENFVEEFEKRNIRKVWMIGSGTSLFASMIAARAWEEELEIDCEAISALEFLEEVAPRALAGDVLVLLISQSAAAYTTLECARAANAAGAMTCVVTAHPQAPIALESNHIVETHTGPEENAGKSKGFTSTAIAAVLLAERISLSGAADADKTLREKYASLPSLFQEALDQSLAGVADWVKRLEKVDALYAVGAGTQVPTAREGGLKVLEVAKLPVLSLDLEEAMHGPMNGVGETTGILLVADVISQPKRLEAFVKGLKVLGGPSVTMAAGPEVSSGEAFDLVLPPCENAGLRAIRGVVPFQILAHELAAARNVSIDTGKYPQLRPIFQTKSIHPTS